MTREQRLELLKQIEKDIYVPSIESTFLEDAKSCAIHSVIEELEQEPRKDEVILTKEEYGELLSSEFDNGYAKGYREALEQEPILDKVKQAREEIEHLSKYGKETYYRAIDDVLAILDKLIESEE